MNKTRSLAVLGGLAVAGVVTASAASLGGITNDQLGASVDLVASCDIDGVDAAFTTAYTAPSSPTPPEVGTYNVTAVDVSGIDASCANQTLDLTLTDEDGLAISSGTVATLGAGGTATVSVTPVDAEAVTGVAVVISG